ncbi:MAG TPA: hypothetical protein VGA98_03735 [Allosphingosinicella sp.]|jgi:hypothetical protein
MRFRKAFEWVVIAALLATCLFISITDLLGLAKSEKFLGRSWDEIQIVLIALLGIYIIMMRLEVDRLVTSEANRVVQQVADSKETILMRLSEVAEQERAITERIEQALGERFVQALPRYDLFMNYVVSAVSSAKHTVDDLSWAHPDKTLPWNSDKSSLEARYEKAVNDASRRIQYREVFIFNRADRIERAKRRLAGTGPGYSCACYRESDVPRLQFMIVDAHEVILMRRRDTPAMVIRNEDIVRHFREYYEAVWARSTALNPIGRILPNIDEFADVRDSPVGE